VQIDQTFYLTYTAFNGINALGALAASTDLINWERHGIMVPQITYQEFKHFLEAEGSMHEKYIRFNDYQISHEKQDRKIFLWDKTKYLFICR
jgi:predicted GH43/DUF377 family glycosyl hydrolase